MHHQLSKQTAHRHSQAIIDHTKSGEGNGPMIQLNSYGDTAFGGVKPIKIRNFQALFGNNENQVLQNQQE
jgi:hypothetical protein